MYSFLPNEKRVILPKGPHPEYQPAFLKLQTFYVGFPLFYMAFPQALVRTIFLGPNSMVSWGTITPNEITSYIHRH